MENQWKFTHFDLNFRIVFFSRKSPGKRAKKEWRIPIDAIQLSTWWGVDVVIPNTMNTINSKQIKIKSGFFAASPTERKHKRRQLHGVDSWAATPIQLNVHCWFLTSSFACTRAFFVCVCCIFSQTQVRCIQSHLHVYSMLCGVQKATVTTHNSIQWLV